MRHIKTILLFIFVISAVVGLDRRWGRTPALGRVLNPFRGLWREPFTRQLKDLRVELNGLSDSVKVLWDEYGVPHIQAKNMRDLYLAQGYVHASQRLFQMEVQARAGGARMAELLGGKAISVDRFFIRLGMRDAVKRSVETLLSDPQTKEAVEAYSEGVNSYVAGLNETTLPVEYRLLGRRPMNWSSARTAEFLKIMSFRLAARSYDLPQARFQKMFGTKRVLDLFPDFLPDPYETPFIRHFLPSAPKIKMPPREVIDFVSDIKEFPDILKSFATNGSNSWAVGPAKSQGGRSILANDTHLGLSLPSGFFEQQLEAPGLNVYGVSFPNVPGVVIGFNQAIAWGVTNATTDVLDWYEVEFANETSLDYKIGEETFTADEHNELFSGQGGGVKETVPVVWTKLGVVMHREGKLALVARWTAHDAGRELKSFMNLAKSQSAEECRHSVDDFVSPAGNLACADEKNISMTHYGRFPLRFPGQGRFVMNGRDPRTQWQGWIARDAWPEEVNPSEGYVFSANQRPTKGTYPYYLGWDFENGYRGRRVVEELESKDQLSPQDMMAMQYNAVNPLARAVLPELILQLKVLSAEQSKFVKRLKDWNFVDSTDSQEATVFFRWWEQLKRDLWQDQLGEPQQNVWPRDQRTEMLIHRAAAGHAGDDGFWIDDVTTPAQETFSDIANRSFRKAWDVLISEAGAPGPMWAWSERRPVHFVHVGRFPGFDRTISAPGSRHDINALRDNHGPTFRMVVVAGDPQQAWTSIPGGTGGSPMSPDYQMGIREWSEGRLKKIHFYSASGEKSEAGQRAVWTLEAQREK